MSFKSFQILLGVPKDPLKIAEKKSTGLAPITRRETSAQNSNAAAKAITRIMTDFFHGKTSLLVT